MICLLGHSTSAINKGSGSFIYGGILDDDNEKKFIAVTLCCPGQVSISASQTLIPRQ